MLSTAASTMPTTEEAQGNVIEKRTEGIGKHIFKALFPSCLMMMLLMMMAMAIFIMAGRTIIIILSHGCLSNGQRMAASPEIGGDAADNTSQESC